MMRRCPRPTRSSGQIRTFFSLFHHPYTTNSPSSSICTLAISSHQQLQRCSRRRVLFFLYFFPFAIRNAFLHPSPQLMILSRNIKSTSICFCFPPLPMVHIFHASVVNTLLPHVALRFLLNNKKRPLREVKGEVWMDQRSGAPKSFSTPPSLSLYCRIVQ